jgi:hypothetical protein
MTETVKDILSNKLKEAKAREGLDNYEVSQILGFNSQHYAGKVISKTIAQRDKVPVEAWRAVQRWTNSGLSLRAFGEKKSRISEAAGELVGTLGSEIPDPIPLTQDQERETGAIIPPKNDGHWQVKGEDFYPMPKPGDEVVLKLRGEEIGRAVVDKVEDPDMEAVSQKPWSVDQIKKMNSGRSQGTYEAGRHPHRCLGDHI